MLPYLKIVILSGLALLMMPSCKHANRSAVSDSPSAATAPSYKVSGSFKQRNVVREYTIFFDTKSQSGHWHAKNLDNQTAEDADLKVEIARCPGCFVLEGDVLIRGSSYGLKVTTNENKVTEILFAGTTELIGEAKLEPASGNDKIPDNTATPVPCDDRFQVGNPNKRPEGSEAECNACALYNAKDDQTKTYVDCKEPISPGLCFLGNQLGVFGTKLVVDNPVVIPVKHCVSRPQTAPAETVPSPKPTVKNSKQILENPSSENLRILEQREWRTSVFNSQLKASQEGKPLEVRFKARFTKSSFSEGGTIQIGVASAMLSGKIIQPQDLKIGLERYAEFTTFRNTGKVVGNSKCCKGGDVCAEFSDTGKNQEGEFDTLLEIGLQLDDRYDLNVARGCMIRMDTEDKEYVPGQIVLTP